jgi:hypothetical protein
MGNARELGVVRGEGLSGTREGGKIESEMDRKPRGKI